MDETIRMKKKTDSNLISKYVRGKYSWSELKQLIRWFEDDQYEQDLRSDLSLHWEELPLKVREEKDLSKVFSTLKAEILSDRTRATAVEKLRRLYIRVAAVLLLPLLIYTVFSLTRSFPASSVATANWIEITSPGGARTHFSLPDGTKVSLNSASRLRYPADFDRHRLVAIEGEGYFDVIHDPRRPFIVRTPEMDVKVLGTKFSVISVNRDSTTEVILKEGKVMITGKENQFAGELLANESFYYDRRMGKGEVRKVDAGSLTAWKDGLLVFRSEPLGSVLKRLGRWYNVRFEVLDKKLEEFSYRATFQDEPLEEVLRLISMTAPVSYQIKERTKDKNDIYEEKVITIGLKK
jgi:ferric-dicitrate binding protein FerR (iron transport regulator)